MARTWAGLIGCASLALAATALAVGSGQAAPKEQHGGHPNGGAPPGGGKAKHQHHEKNGHMLLGAKLKQDGKHAVGKFGSRDVVADVRGGKVAGMSAGDVQGKPVRSKTKMAFAPGGLIRAAWNPPAGVALAQVVDYYEYGYCFDDGINYDCYWYPPEDVDTTSDVWADYDPYY